MPLLIIRQVNKNVPESEMLWEVEQDGVRFQMTMGDVRRFMFS